MKFVAGVKLKCGLNRQNPYPSLFGPFLDQFRIEAACLGENRSDWSSASKKKFSENKVWDIKALRVG